MGNDIGAKETKEQKPKKESEKKRLRPREKKQLEDTAANAPQPEQQSQLFDDLNDATLELLMELERERAKYRDYVTGGWMTHPGDFSAYVMGTWQDFLDVALQNRLELTRFVSPLALASGMQMLYARFVSLWLILPGPKPGEINGELTAIVESDIRNFLKFRQLIG